MDTDSKIREKILYVIEHTLYDLGDDYWESDKLKEIKAKVEKNPRISTDHLQQYLKFVLRVAKDELGLTFPKMTMREDNEVKGTHRLPNEELLGLEISKCQKLSKATREDCYIFMHNNYGVPNIWSMTKSEAMKKHPNRKPLLVVDYRGPVGLTNDHVREAFERWARTKSLPLDVYPDGLYKSDKTDVAWAAFQIGRKG
jgi:hypothetical protein